MKLSFADFSNSDLEDAILSYSDLYSVNFLHSCLIGAKLSYSTLTNAILEDADLSEASLERAVLINPNLDHCRLHRRKMRDTLIVNADFRNAIGREDAVHWGPSMIDVAPFYRSNGIIPTSFLRGIGLDDTFIDYVGSLVGKPIEYYSCFISYSTKNQDFADRLHADLQNNNVRCWLASEDLKIGDKFRTRIEEAIRLHDTLLLVLSETSVASPWVESEVESAMERERTDPEKNTVLFPVMRDNAVMDTGVAWASDVRRTRHIGDFRDWKNDDSYKKAPDRLLRDLKAEANK